MFPSRSTDNGETMLTAANEQGAWYEKMLAVCETLDNDTVTADDTASVFPTEKWTIIANSGIFALPFTVDRREVDGTLPALIGAMEAVGHANADAGLTFSVATQIASSVIPLARFGSADLRSRYASSLGDGTSIGAHAITEVDAGSDALSMATSAERLEDEWLLNGRKSFVSNGPIADLICVYARTGRPGTIAALTAFAVERGTPGLIVGEAADKMGLRTSPLGTLTLQNLRVPADRVVGQPGGGVLLLNHVMAREILLIAAGQIGQMRRLLDALVRRANERVQFGQPIGSYQAVSHAIADVAVGVETSRHWVYQTTTRMAAGEDVTADVAMTKVVVSEAHVAAARTAVQVFGGAGYLTSTGIERSLRDAMAGTIYSGTSEIQRNKIAALLGVGADRKVAW